MKKKFTNKKSRINFGKTVIKKIMVVFVLIISLIMFAFSKPEDGLMRGVYNFSYSVTSGIYDVISYPFVKISEGFKAVVFMYNIKEKYEQNLLKLKEYESELVKMELVAAENQRLKQYIKFVGDVEYSFITATPVISTNENYRKSFIIKTDQTAGVRKYQAVLSNNSLIGYVSQVNGEHIQVILLNDSYAKIPVMVERTGVRAFLKGDNTSSPKVIYFEKKMNVKVGDKIVTSGFGGNMPKGINVGVVSSVGEEDGVVLQPYENFSDAEFVRIIKY